MIRTRVFACAIAVAASLAGCRSTGDVEYAGEVNVTSPELIEISPGVQVVADADEPLFYAHGAYWLHRDGYWFTSSNYFRGFARVDFAMVPQQLRTIERPEAYAHYQSNLGRTRQARTPQMQRRTQRPVQPQGPTGPADPYAPAQQPPSGDTSPQTPPADLPDQATPPPEADTDYRTDPIDAPNPTDRDTIDETLETEAPLPVDE